MWTISVGILVVLMPYLVGNQAQAPSAIGESAAANQTKTASGLIYEIVVKGTGPMAQRGDKLRIHETLSLPDGKVIFNSREKNQTVTFVLGANQVIAGVDEGVTGMRVGERRKLLVPPSLGSASVGVSTCTTLPGVAPASYAPGANDSATILHDKKEADDRTCAVIRSPAPAPRSIVARNVPLRPNRPRSTS